MAILDQNGCLRYANSAFDTLRHIVDACNAFTWDTPLQAPVFAPLRAAFLVAVLELRRSGLAAQRCELAVLQGGVRRRFIASISHILTSAGIAARRGERLFLLVLHESAAAQDERIVTLRRRHQLTAAQARVLHALAEGLNLRQIAAQFDVSVHTVRLHVKALLAKTDCHRQAELVRLVETVQTGRIRVSA